MKRETKQEETTTEAAAPPNEAATHADEVADGRPPEETDAPEGTTPETDSAEALQSRVDELENKLLRVQADFENRRKRLDQQRDELIRYGNVDLARNLLVVLDDLERSLNAARESGSVDSVLEGVALIHANLIKVLRDHGLEEIEALHKPFDPNLHEAMMQQPSAEHPEGTVLEEVAKGYRFKERVVRPTKVIVSKAATPAEEAEASDDEETASNET